MKLQMCNFLKGVRGFSKDMLVNIPQDWRKVSIERDVVLISGIRPSGGALDEGQIPSLGGEHITNDGRVKFTEDNAKYIPESFFRKMRKGKVKRWDILINKDGANTGKVAIVREMFSPEIAINEHLFIVRSTKLFDQKYLFYWFLSSFGQKQIKDRITGSAQPGLPSSFIKNFYVLKPPLPEQRKIAEILETVDRAIEKTDAIIEKYKRIKYGLMQDLLTRGIDENGKSRSKETHRFKDSPLGRIPEEWEVVELGKISFLKGRIGWQGLTTQEYLEDGKYYLVTGINFKNGQIDWETCVYVTRRRYEMDKNIQLKGNEVLVTKDGTIGKVAYIDKLPKPATLGTGVFILRPLENAYYPKYLYYVLTSPIFDRFIDILQAGSTINHLYQRDFVKFKLPLPPLPEQKRIAEILSQIDAVIEKEEMYKEKLEREKRGLMEDLLTGRVRVTQLLNGGDGNGKERSS